MRQLLLSLILVGFAGTALAKGDAEAGKARATVCAACHGADGNKSIDDNTPKLAGQYAGYLVKALQDYRSGARVNAVMNTQAAQLKDQDIADLAAYYASLPGDVKDLSELK